MREPLNCKDLYGKATDLSKMVETNIVLSYFIGFSAFFLYLKYNPSFSPAALLILLLRRKKYIIKERLLYLIENYIYIIDY